MLILVHFKGMAKLPMWFTYFRMMIAPFIMAILTTNASYAGWIAAILFIIGSFTDWVDGYLARKFAVESNMGKFMDPIADKILVLGSILILLAMGRVDPFLVFLLVGRDIFIGGLRAVAAADQIVIAAKPFGKWKTATQMLAIPCLMIYEPLFGLPLADTGYFLLWFSVVLSLISGAEYSLGYFSKARKPSA